MLALLNYSLINDNNNAVVPKMTNKAFLFSIKKKHKILIKINWNSWIYMGNDEAKLRNTLNNTNSFDKNNSKNLLTFNFCPQITTNFRHNLAHIFYSD